jgi:hypothetical protein
MSIDDRSHWSSSSSSSESFDRVKAEVILVAANASGVSGKITFKQVNDIKVL